MVNNSRAMSRKEAVEFGRTLCQDMGLFSGIDGSKDFKDDYLLYRFEERFQERFSSTSKEDAIFRRGVVSGIEGISGMNVKSIPLLRIAEAFRNGIDVKDHRGRVSRKKHKDTFYGRDAVNFIVAHGLAEDRVAAVDLGRTLAREFDLFEHVKGEHEFKDRKHLYRFKYEGEILPMEVLELNKSKLTVIAKAFVANVKVEEHRKDLIVFKNTFVGSEAVEFLVNSEIASSRKEAVQMGRAITKEFNLFEHVTKDRQFEDTNVLYSFAKEEDWYKGLKFERQLGRRNVFVVNETSYRPYSDPSIICDFSESEVELSKEDYDMKESIELFEKKIQELLRPKYIKTIHEDDGSVERKTKENINKFMAWACKFHRLDPRYQIRYFFDSLAQDGAKKVEKENFSVSDLRQILNFLPSQAQVFSVWRPTSLHAIRKMMCGEAVGKGLDIKGKSAKRGKLSGFVPFLQLGENKHKSKIRPPSKEGVVRLFYPGEARRARDIAAENLERVAHEMMQTVTRAKKVLDNNDASKEDRDSAMECMLLDMNDPKIVYLDEYAPDRYGFEIPERLFWEAYFSRQDCTRKPGSEYDIGRPSQPAFQDMNFAALRAQPKEDAPRACVYQYADPGEPMNPFELLVAYEEHGRVMPVVSGELF